MKTAFLALGVALLGMTSIADGKQVSFNRQLGIFTKVGNKFRVSPIFNHIIHEAQPISFELAEADPLRQNLLAGVYGDDTGLHNCSYSEEKVNSGSVTVLLAISKCLNQSSINMIEDWVDSIKDEQMSYFQDGQQVELHFSTTLIPGECEARSERNKNGFENRNNDTWQEGEDLMLSNEVLPGDVARISAFAKFGRVLDAVPIGADDIPIAVISFVNNEKSFSVVEQYERKFQISNTFNFQLCDGGLSCQGHFENCIFLQEGIDLFMYNPFTVVRSFTCDSLTDGIPVSYVDSTGERQCFCACGAGFEQAVDAYGHARCVPVQPEVCPCTWSTHPYGFKIENEEEIQDQCVFTDFATRWGLPVPFPSDNYVADNRVNDHDNSVLGNSPHIDLKTTPMFNDIYDYVTIAQYVQSLFSSGKPYSPGAFPPDFQELAKALGFDVPGGLVSLYSPPNSRGDTETDEFTWRDYQLNRNAKIDDLTLTAYGKYELQVGAYDYQADAQCVGCLAIVDKYRPQATTTCPASFCDNTTSACHTFDEATSELTVSNLDTANGLINSVYDFGEKAKNDVCSSDRCDMEIFGLKNFFESDYCSDKQWSEGKKCFDRTEVEQDFIKSSVSKTNPLFVHKPYGYGIAVKQVDVPVAPGQCTRCCSYVNQLRELWTDYTCGYNYDLRYCSGLESQHCEFKQCLVLFGDTLATVSARIKPTVAEDSKHVLEKVVQKGFQTYTQVHRALQCSTFDGTDGVCDFESTIADLFETQSRSNLDTVDVGNPDDYVFWRYKVKGDASGWHLLNAAEEEAITHVFKTAETKITIEAWTQCGIVRKFYFDVHLHLNSDIKVCDKFSEMWYQSTVSRLPTSTDLCAYPGSDFAELTFDYHPNVGLQYDRKNLRMNVTSVVCKLHFFDREETEIIHVDEMSPEIVTRFAVELQNQAETKPITRFHVSCDFTYTRADASTITHNCCRDFSIKDCTPPEIDQPYSECQNDACAGDASPGPGEACGGNIVRASNTATYMDTEEVECCQSCGENPTVCQAVMDLPEGDNIKRCVPQIDAEYGNVYGNTAREYYDEVVRMSSAIATGEKHAAATALVAASALVALVALVVVKRRRAQAPVKVDNDAYYPLLH